MASPHPQITAKTPGTFAYKVMKDNMPCILSKIVDTLSREREKIAKLHEKEDPDIKEKVKQIIGGISKLRNEVMTDKPFIPIEDSRSDAKVWNERMEDLKTRNGGSLSWFNSPWYFAESYLYRRLKELFHFSETLEYYDPFSINKMNGLLNTLESCEHLGDYLLDRCNNISSISAIELEKAVRLVIQLSLWGNRFDLSLTCGEDIPQREDPVSTIDGLKKNLLVDDSQKILDVLKAAKTTHLGRIRMDLVMDNAGFEAFSDLCMLDFLCTAGVVNVVHLHVKGMPWFVSDTTVADLNNIFEYLSTSSNNTLHILGERWKIYVNKGMWIIKADPFWITPFYYRSMKAKAPKLYEELCTSNLVIFKGDLNYRKLVGELQWPNTTPFKESLQGFEPAPVAVLRTLKAEVVTGLKKGQAEATAKIAANWMITGKFAVIQFAPAKSKS